ncbi:mitochondrial ribosomal protein S23 [Brevipalpus obovatus]|uniref:mitochondrial ribosomal protein S23 n=1 Tax=Brevipalpus obovatus TaxID=246614 RepID=UPI003D9E921E
MAQSRLPKFSHILDRMEGLIKSGVVKFENRPIWYDVLKSFPPSIWPDWLRPEPKYIEKPIFYPEDRIRAHFFKTFNAPGIIDLTDSSRRPPSEIFIEKYIQIALNPDNSKLSRDQVSDLARRDLQEMGYQIEYRKRYQRQKTEQPESATSSSSLSSPKNSSTSMKPKKETLIDSLYD